ncbi:hypothetical protein Q5752_005374 [Cryptotrichosporon argae]
MQSLYEMGYDPASIEPQVRPQTAAPPTTSALATHLAVSSPMAAMRSQSVDAMSVRNGPSGALDPASTPSQPSAAMTSLLHSAEDIARRQKARIDAQNDARNAGGQAYAALQQARAATPARQMGQVGVGALGPGQIAQLAQLGHFAHNGQAIQLPNGQIVFPDHARHDMFASPYAYNAQPGMHIQHPAAHTPVSAPIAVAMSRQLHPPAAGSGKRQLGSPATDPGAKRGDESPSDAPNKRAKAGKKGTAGPTPEDHQRRALEVANRIGMPMRSGSISAPTVPPVPMRPPLPPGVPQAPHDAQRLYAQQQFEATQRQMAARVQAQPVAAAGALFTGSPSTPSPMALIQQLPGPRPGPPPALQLQIQPQASSDDLVPETPTTAGSAKRKVRKPGQGKKKKTKAAEGDAHPDEPADTPASSRLALGWDAAPTTADFAAAGLFAEHGHASPAPCAASALDAHDHEGADAQQQQQQQQQPAAPSAPAQTDAFPPPAPAELPELAYDAAAYAPAGQGAFDDDLLRHFINDEPATASASGFPNLDDYNFGAADGGDDVWLQFGADGADG